MDDVIEGALLVGDALEDLGVAHYVGGSLASSAYGEFRATADADIVADIQLPHIDPLIRALSADFHIDAEMIRDAIRRRASFNLIGYRLLAKIDIFIPKDRPYSRAAFERRVRHVVDPETQRKIYLASPEDIILAKLEWFRLGHEVSERQWRDIHSILLARKGALDLAYLQLWAVDLGVADLLQRALEEVT